MENLSIRKIIDKISSGEIRIPSFQRGFVWEPDSIAFFMDSLYKGYGLLSPFEWWCRNFILPDICKPCLFVFLRNLFYLTGEGDIIPLCNLYVAVTHLRTK